MVYKMLIFLSFFCCFSVKTKTRIPVKSKAFYPSSGKNDQGGIYILYIDLSKNCCSRNYVHTNVFLLYNSFKFIFCYSGVLFFGS